MFLFTERLSLVSENDDISKARFCILGVPFDSTESHLPGARLGPNAVRESFLRLETRDLSSALYDAGNITAVPGNAAETLKRVESTLDDVSMKNKDIVPVLLGGEHTITLAAVRSLRKRHKGLQVVAFDSHWDLKNDFLGEKLAHSTVLRRVAEFGIPLTIIGAREGSEDEARYAEKINTGIGKIDLRRPIYVSIDVDVFDPSLAPGVGNPVPGGLGWSEFAKLFKDLIKGNIVGADIVEVNPLVERFSTPCIAADCLRVLLRGFFA